MYSRMESTGEPNRIHVSKSTAELLKEAGKTYWVRPREDLVHAKGKGNVQTFWIMSRSGTGQGNGLEPSKSSETGVKRSAPGRSSSMFSSQPVRGIQRTQSGSVVNNAPSHETAAASQASDNIDRQREDRLVQWQLELFTRLLKRIVAARIEKNKKLGKKEESSTEPPLDDDDDEVSFTALNDSFAVQLEKISEDRFAGNPNANARATSLEIPKKIGSFMKPNQEESIFKMPKRRPSLRGFSSHSVSTLFSVDSLPVSVLGSSAGDLSFAESEVSQPQSNLNLTGFDDIIDEEDEGKIVVDEVAEIIALPQFSAEAINALAHADEIQLNQEVVSQLKDYIATIAHMYRKNPFHNFEVSQVSLSCGSCRYMNYSIC